MADKSQHLNNKRSQEIDHQDPDPEQNPEKRLNLDGDENSESDNTSEKKTITNIYYDCLERIFDFLDLESLLMVAQTCKRLQIAANAKFGDDYGDKTFLMGAIQSTCSLQPKINGFIYFYSWKLGFPFLRCFGSKIKQLQVDFYERMITRIDYFHQYIRQYCTENLIILRIINNYWEFSIKNYQYKPFENVQDLQLANVDIRDELQEFVNYVPRLRRLTIHRSAINENATDVLFPYLTHLDLEVDHNIRCRLTRVGATNLLHANRQIQSLKISTMTLKFDEIMNMISDNPFIKELSLVVEWKFTDVDVIKLKRFEKLYLHSMDYKYTADEAMALIQQLNSLQKFSFYIKNQTEIDHFLSQLDNNKWQHDHNNHTQSVWYVNMRLTRRI